MRLRVVRGDVLRGAVDVGALYITNDGKTRIYITLQDGRTSPMLGCCPKGTVTVDWGDGTTPDVLSGNASSSSLPNVKWTPHHNYAAPGDYVITLTVSGKMWFYGRSSSDQYSAILRHSSEADDRNQYYKNAVLRIEIGGGIEEISTYAFSECMSLETITIPEEIKKVGTYAFFKCYSLRNINLSSIPYMPDGLFQDCEGMKNVSIPNGILRLDTYVFSGCRNLSRVTIPDENVVPEWVQPDSTNPYMKGDRVLHNGKTWESLIDTNTWEPGAVGTESLWVEVA